jgi:hypothetical protein
MLHIVSMVCSFLVWHKFVWIICLCRVECDSNVNILQNLLILFDVVVSCNCYFFPRDMMFYSRVFSCKQRPIRMYTNAILLHIVTKRTLDCWSSIKNCQTKILGHLYTSQWLTIDNFHFIKLNFTSYEYPKFCDVIKVVIIH